MQKGTKEAQEIFEIINKTEVSSDHDSDDSVDGPETPAGNHKD